MHETSTRLCLALWAAAVVLMFGCTSPEGAKQPATGQQLYAACSTCHGIKAQGLAHLGAPSIAGLPAWYLEAQLHKFRTGIRGAHPDDMEGLRMRPMSRLLQDEGQVAAVSSYISSLPLQPQPRTLPGDATQGAAQYVVCLACHGPTGAGNKDLKAPPIAGQFDWYLIAQLKKFRAGMRGTDPRDISGATMRPMSMTLADDQAMQNVVAHIATLTR